MDKTFQSTWRPLNIFLIFSGNPYFWFNISKNVYQFKLIVWSIIWSCLIPILYFLTCFFTWNSSGNKLNRESPFAVATMIISILAYLLMQLNATASNVLMLSRQLRVINCMYQLDEFLSINFKYYPFLKTKHWKLVFKILLAHLSYTALLVLFFLSQYQSLFLGFDYFSQITLTVIALFQTSSMQLFGTFCATRLSTAFKCLKFGINEKTDQLIVLLNVYEQVYKTYRKVSEQFGIVITSNISFSLLIQSIHLYDFCNFTYTSRGLVIYILIIPATFQSIPVYYQWGQVAAEVSFFRIRLHLT